MKTIFYHKAQAMSPSQKKSIIHRRSKLSITHQCELVSISPSNWDYDTKGESLLNQKLMRLIDEQFLETPI